MAEVNERKMWESVLVNPSSEPEDKARAKAELEAMGLTDCEHCYHYIIQRGLFPHYVCLEDMPEDIQNAYGKGCPSWKLKPKRMDTRGKEGRFQTA